MDVVHERCAGMDISKTDAKVCVRVPGPRPGQYSKTVTTYGATSNEVLRLRADLVTAQVTEVVMEATGDYWKPFLFVLEEAVPVHLVNAKQAKNIPGRKTDVSDAVWLAELAAHGLLRTSFVPDEPIRQLRDLTRTRTNLTGEQTREYNRLDKLLQDAGIKLSSVASTLAGLSSRRILDAMVAGETDPQVLAALVHASMRKKTPELVEALTGRFKDQHNLVTGLHLRRIDQLQALISEISDRIDQVAAPFHTARDALTTIPGISTPSAEVIIAEIGVDMSVFQTAGHLASWAGVCPGQNESAGRRKSTATRPGNRHLKAVLGTAAMSASKSKTSYLAVKYRRILTRRGKPRAIVAIEHTILVAIWNMLTTGEAFNDPGSGYQPGRDPGSTLNKALKSLRDLGYQVELTPATAA